MCAGFVDRSILRGCLCVCVCHSPVLEHPCCAHVSVCTLSVCRCCHAYLCSAGRAFEAVKDGATSLAKDFKSFFSKIAQATGLMRASSDDGGRSSQPAAEVDEHSQARLCVEIFKLMRKGVLLLDEVDMILHPLKSELNWPIGEKEPLDFTRSSFGFGLRWKVPYHLLDAVFYASGTHRTINFNESREALIVLESIKMAVKSGIEQRVIQTTPRLLLRRLPVGRRCAIR